MKTADDAAARAAPAGDLIVSAEDDITGTAGGAEPRGLGHRQQVQVAEDEELSWPSGSRTLAQMRRIAGVTLRQIREPVESQSRCRQ